MFAAGSRVAAGSGVHPQGAFARSKPMISGTPAALPCPNLFLFLYSMLSCFCAFNEEFVVSQRFRPPGFPPCASNRFVLGTVLLIFIPIEELVFCFF